MLGEKFMPVLEKTSYVENYESDDEIFEIFNLKNQRTKKSFCKFFKIGDKKYNVNLKTICNLIAPLKKLKRMIGLKNVKEQIFETIIYYLQGFENKNKNMMHSVIEGPPGVGKTKLGKILAQIYCAMGIIPSSKFKYVKATDMIGEHVGATKHMTQSVIDEADGGVLFIDEAYALSTGDSKDPYGKECMDTLNFNLSENKKKLIVIIAGYPEQLEKNFFSHNPGLQRRFPFRYKIDKYSAKELMEIFQEKIKLNKWKINNNITSKFLEDFFNKNMELFENFGGDIENFLKKCQFSHSKRTIGLHPSFRGKLTIDDLNNGLLNFKKNKKEGDKKFWEHMYV
jgi:SpoVK/Ycf46/Vps4 family AAA+-type ATPase